MLDPQEIGWNTEKSGRQRKAEPLLTIVQDVMDRLIWRIDASEDIMVNAVARVTDREFIEGCTVGPVEAGVLKIVVHDERLVYTYRIRWAFNLLEGLRKLCPSAGIRQVRFVSERSAQGRTPQRH